MGLGKLVGTRTWGGLVGNSGNPALVDGGQLRDPSRAMFAPDGTWAIEGEGVAPDVVVEDDPGRTAGGRDPQLDAAVAHLLAELARAPARPARPPARRRSEW
jgi:tricorn protease